MRVSLRTGLKATPGEKETVLEAFKPTEEPDDEYSVIGFTNEFGHVRDPGADAIRARWAPARACGEGRARLLSTRLYGSGPAFTAPACSPYIRR